MLQSTCTIWFSTQRSKTTPSWSCMKPSRTTVDTLYNQAGQPIDHHVFHGWYKWTCYQSNVSSSTRVHCSINVAITLAKLACCMRPLNQSTTNPWQSKDACHHGWASMPLAGASMGWCQRREWMNECDEWMRWMMPSDARIPMLAGRVLTRVPITDGYRYPGYPGYAMSCTGIEIRGTPIPDILILLSSAINIAIPTSARVHVYSRAVHVHAWMCMYTCTHGYTSGRVLQ